MEIRNLYNGALVCDPACPDVIFRIWRKNEEGTYLMADNVLRQKIGTTSANVAAANITITGRQKAVTEASKVVIST